MAQCDIKIIQIDLVVLEKYKIIYYYDRYQQHSELRAQEEYLKNSHCLYNRECKRTLNRQVHEKGLTCEDRLFS